MLILIINPLIAFQKNNAWVQDLDFLEQELEIRHADIYHTYPKNLLHNDFSELKNQATSLSHFEILFELEKILCRINDGHTGLLLLFNNDIQLQFVPLKLLKLENSMVVTKVSVGFDDLLGARITAIEGSPINNIFELIKDFIPHDNQYSQAELFIYYVTISDLLKYVGLPISDKFVTCSFVKQDGNKVSIQLPLVSKTQYDQLAGNDNANQPLWLSTNKGKFWHIQFDSLLYIQLNSSDIGGLESEMELLAWEVIQLAGSDAITKIALDLRLNGGGSLRRTYPILKSMITIDQTYPQKTQFVMISNRTFSAGTSLAALMDRLTNAIFVGSPTGGKPNTVGDLGWITLPNHNIRVRYSRLHVKNSDEWDARPAIMPDLIAPITYKNYLDKKDPGLEVIKIYKGRKNLIPTLMKYKEDITQLLKVYRDLRDNHYNEYGFYNEVLSDVTFQLYQDGFLTPDAGFKILDFYVNEQPWSPVAQSNMGILYLQSGDTTTAMNYFKKAFQIHKGYTRWRNLLNLQNNFNAK